MATLTLSGKDYILEIKVGQAQDGTLRDGGTPTWGQTRSLTAKFRAARFSRVYRTEDVSGAGEPSEVVRVLKYRDRCEIEGLVRNDLEFYPTAGLETGKYIEVNFKPRSTLQTFRVFTGVITEWGHEAGEGLQSERIVCEAPAE